MTIPDYFKVETFDPEMIEWHDQGLRSHQRIAARFAQYASGRCLYVDGLGWHYWDKTRWAIDSRGKHAHKVLTELLTLCTTREVLDSKELLADLRAANTANGSNGVLDLASRQLEADAADMDNDPYLLNVQNGTLDLRTLELRPHDPADLITKVTRASYYPDAHSDRWTDFLNSSLPDMEIQEFLQRFIGSALIGAVLDHVLVVATGGGRNGKGVIAETVRHALGDYTITASNQMLVASRYGGNSAGEKASLMRLRGARFATMSELEKGVQLAESTMKQLTGGDSIEAKLMGQNPVEFEPSHSFFMLTNDLPKVDPTAQAVWARIRVVPFNISFEGREDPNLKQDLKLAAEAVISWAVAGLWGYQKEGLNAPAQVMASTENYRAENDDVKQFIADQCELVPNARVTRSELLHAYLAWARDNGGEQLTGRAFTPRIAKIQGITEGKSNGNLVWKGVGLKNDESAFD
ncbi:DNA primase family protein [Glutamicibacter sp.]|uniref:DNA primase family protein n=1 Tax=Glutamicibacter sp. TaxID=1931995 RepID=UPI002FE0B7FF